MIKKERIWLQVHWRTLFEYTDTGKVQRKEEYFKCCSGDEIIGWTN
jgi:hypothetical protein